MALSHEAVLPLSYDSLLGGRVRFRQPERGYRVNVDSLLLAHFACAGKSARLAVDLGAGVGLVGLLLSHYGAARELVLVEREPALAELARGNLEQAGVRASVHELDVQDEELADKLDRRADLVVCNPPFYKEGEHRLPNDESRERARVGELEPFLAATAKLLAGSKARAAFVYPARSLSEVFDAARRLQLVPKRLQMVHAFADRAARLALIELRRAKPGGLVIEPPIIEWLAPGVATPLLLELTEGPASDRK
ncbi:MAG: tRNA1(Val) (adenine(37)-N6)-methyltransferase [Myxococcota bacterium]